MLFKTKIDKATAYLLFIMFLCFCLCQYGLQRIFGFSLFPDEFGYWAPAAKMLGWDWSEATSLGSYYSFGYSLILTPVLYFVKDSIMAYRAAVVLNMFMMCIGLYLLYCLMQKLFPGTEKERAAIISGIAVLYPPWIFYMQMTMTEALLLFLYILICWIFICFLEKPRALTAVFLVLALVYIYFVHMRSIGIIAAGGITLAIWAVAGKSPGRRKKVFFVLVLLLGLFFLGLYMKNMLIDMLYHSASEEILGYNDYSGQWDKLRYLISGGWKSFLAGCAAKALYLGMATFGLAYRGFAYAVKKVIDAVKTRHNGGGNADSCFWVFLTLASAAQFFVTVIYTIGSADKGNNRLDLFIQGRYSELMIPILIALGLIQLLESRRVWIGTGLTAAGTAILTLFAVRVIENSDTGMTNIHGYTMLGMSYVLKEGSDSPVPYLWKAWLFGAVLMGAAALIVVIYRKMQRMNWILFLFVILEIGLGLQAGEHYIYIGNSYGYGDVRMADKVKELTESDAERIIFIYEGGTPYIEQVQFRLRERKVEVWDWQEFEEKREQLPSSDKVLLEAGSQYKEEMEQCFEKNWEAGHLCLYYN